MSGRRLLGAALDVLVFALGLFLFARPSSSHDAPANWDAITYSAASASIARGDGPWFEMESLRLAKVELERQLAATTHERRRAALTEAIAELDRRIAGMK